MINYIKQKPYDICKYTQPITTPSGIIAESCIYYGISVKPDGINDVVLNIYDSLDASGDRLLPSEISIPAASRLTSFMSQAGLWCYNGIYVDVTCSGIYEYQVYYDA